MEDITAIIEILNKSNPLITTSINTFKNIMSSYKLSKSKSKELSKSLRQLVLEFRSNARLAAEYFKSPPGNQFYSPDNRLINCSMTWSFLSYNHAEELEIPIEIHDFINSVYERFEKLLTPREYESMSKLFDYLADYFTKLYEERR